MTNDTTRSAEIAKATLLLEITATRTALSTEVMAGRGRKRQLTRARQLFVLAASSQTDLTGLELGHMLGRSQPSISYLVDTGYDRAQVDSEFQGQLQDIVRTFQLPPAPGKAARVYTVNQERVDEGCDALMETILDLASDDKLVEIIGKARECLTTRRQAARSESK